MISILVSTLAQWSILKSNRQFPYCMLSSSTMNIVSGKEIALNKEKNLDMIDEDTLTPFAGPATQLNIDLEMNVSNLIGKM